MPFLKAITSVLLVRYIPYLLVIPILLFQALSLSGCLSTSPSLPSLYIVSITKNATSFPDIRVGYFGMCTSSNVTGTHCVRTVRSSAELILPSLFPNLTTTTTTHRPRSVLTSPSTKDLTSILDGALNLQSHVFNPTLAASGVLFLASVVLLFFLKRNLKRGGGAAAAQHLRLAMMWALFLGIAVNLTSCLAVTEAVAALQYSPLLSGTSGEGATVVGQGTALQVLQWLSFGLTSLFAASVPWLLRGAGGSAGGVGKLEG